MSQTSLSGPSEEYGEAPPKGGAFRSFLLDQLIAQRVNYDTDTPNLTGEDAAYHAMWNGFAAMREISEMVNRVDGWKPWQNLRENTGTVKDRAKYIEEGVDVLKFVGNLLLLAGATDEELSAVWDEKTQVNADRQAVGYAGVGDEWDAQHRKEA